MANDEIGETMAGIRAALIADPDLAAVVGDRVLDDPRQDVAFPFVRFGNMETVSDDTDGTEGTQVQVGLEVHSRPEWGRVEATGICKMIQAVLHRHPEVVDVQGYTVVDIEVQTWLVARQKDGATYEGKVALVVHLDA